MLNHIVLMGRLTRDPELRHTGTGVPVASFTLAVDRDFSGRDGGQKETDFIDIVAWRNIINEIKHTLSKRKVEKDTIVYLGVKPKVESISGTAKMYRDDGFLLSEDNLDAFDRKTMTGTRLCVTNKPEPVPEDPTTKPEYRLSVLEAENKELKERLAESDEVAIDLYEASLAQEAINAEQDEAIIEIYEQMEGLNNG